jgi:hypothetical protein
MTKVAHDRVINYVLPSIVAPKVLLKQMEKERSLGASNMNIATNPLFKSRFLSCPGSVFSKFLKINILDGLVALMEKVFLKVMLFHEGIPPLRMTRNVESSFVNTPPPCLNIKMTKI